MKRAITIVLAVTGISACTHQAEPKAATEVVQPADPVVTPATPAAGGSSFVYDPKTKTCLAVNETSDAMLDRMRAKAGDECFNLVATDLGFTRIMCPQIAVQVIQSSSSENCMKGMDEIIPDYVTISHPQIDTLKAPTAEQLANFRMKVLRGPLAMYRYHTGTFPSDSVGLKALLMNPQGTTGWQGPYVQDGAGFSDPWQNEFVYKTYDNGKRYKLTSRGSDKILGTKDDQEFRPYP